MLNSLDVNMFVQEFKFIHYEKGLKLNPYAEEVDLLINLFFMHINFKSTVVIGITRLDDISPLKLVQTDNTEQEKIDFLFSIFKDVVNMFNFYYHDAIRVNFNTNKNTNKMILTVVSKK